MTPTFHDQDGPGGVCLCYALVCWCYMETWVEVWRHQGRPAQDKPTDSQTKNASNSNPHVALLPTVLCARHNWPAEHSCMSRIHAGSQAYSIAASDCRRCMQAHLSLHETQLSHRMHTARSVLLGYRRGRNPAPLLGGGLHRHRPVVTWPAHFRGATVVAGRMHMHCTHSTISCTAARGKRSKKACTQSGMFM